MLLPLETPTCGDSFKSEDSNSNSNKKKKERMAKSRFEYVREFESYTDPSLLPNTWIVVRVDGNGFTGSCVYSDVFPSSSTTHYSLKVL